MNTNTRNALIQAAVATTAAFAVNFVVGRVILGPIYKATARRWPVYY